MPPPDDHFDGSSTLPPPDLNPLLNPLLGQNMARWAEVYFASAPEKREQAVLDLLRELQAEVLASKVAPPAPASEQTSQPVEEPAARIAERRTVLVRCHACGRENPASHRFCGMCGMAMMGREAAGEVNVSDLNVNDLNVSDLNFNDLNIADVPVEDHRVRYPPQGEPTPPPSSNQSHFVSPERASFEPSSRNELPQSGGGRESDYRTDRMDSIFASTPAKPTRVYLGIPLALVLVALGYIAWRGMQPAPAAITQPATQSATPATPPNPSSIDIPDGTSSAGNQAAVPSRDAADPDRKGLSSKANAASRRESPTLVPSKNPQAEALAGYGGEELAMAQRYLNGADGQQRNSAEAANWLWKAIAKHNGQAALLLSDLYLKGEGVAKNCDQARVLLDAAALKGVQGAAERLRHLQAFGCS